MTSNLTFVFPFSVTVYLQLIMFTVKTRRIPNPQPSSCFNLPCGCAKPNFQLNLCLICNSELLSLLRTSYMQLHWEWSHSVSVISCVHFGHPVLHIIRSKGIDLQLHISTIFHYHKYLLHCNMYSGTLILQEFTKFS
jgi:hypothetical protein